MIAIALPRCGRLLYYMPAVSLMMRIVSSKLLYSCELRNRRNHATGHNTNQLKPAFLISLLCNLVNVDDHISSLNPLEKDDTIVLILDGPDLLYCGC